MGLMISSSFVYYGRQDLADNLAMSAEASVIELTNQNRCNTSKNIILRSLSLNSTNS